MERLPLHDSDGVLILEHIPTPVNEAPPPLPKINMIVCVQGDLGIGSGNGLLHNIPQDLKIFRAKTLGKPVIMGRATWDSLPHRPLPERTNIVISTHPRPAISDRNLVWVHSVQQALDYLKQHSVPEAWVIGGATLYTQFAAYATELHATRVQEISPQRADTYFPRAPLQWRRTQVRQFDSSITSPAFEIATYVNDAPKPF